MADFDFEGAVDVLEPELDFEGAQDVPFPIDDKRDTNGNLLTETIQSTLDGMLNIKLPPTVEDKYPFLKPSHVTDKVEARSVEIAGRTAIQTAKAVRWPFWRAIENPLSTVVTDLQEGKADLGTLRRTLQSYVPFYKIPEKEQKFYGEIGDNYWQALVDEPTPGWYKGIWSYGLAVGVEVPAIHAVVKGVEFAATRPATGEEMEIIRTIFKPLKNWLKQGKLDTSKLYKQGNIIKLSDKSELLMNDNVSMVLRGDKIRIPRWAKLKRVPVKAPSVAPEGLVPTGSSPVPVTPITQSLKPSPFMADVGVAKPTKAPTVPPTAPKTPIVQEPAKASLIEESKKFKELSEEQKEVLVGKEVKIGNSPQVWTVSKKLESQEGDLPFEIFYEVQNNKTGELQIVEFIDMSNIRFPTKPKKVISDEQIKSNRENLIASIQAFAKGVKLTGLEDFSEERLYNLFNAFFKQQATEIQKVIVETEKTLSKELPKGKVKPIIHKTTGITKAIDNIVTNEYNLLKEQIRIGEKGRKEGYAVGKREIRAKEALKRKVSSAIVSIENISKLNVPTEYKDQIDSILEDYDLKKRTKKTKAIRAKRADFLEKQKLTGNMDFLPKGYFDDIGKKTLDEMTLDEVEHLRNQIQILSRAGQTKNKLIAMGKERDFQKALDTIVEKGYKLFGKEEVTPTGKDVLTTPRETGIQHIKRKVKEIASAHRKAEFILKTLGINDEVFEIIQSGVNAKLTRSGEIYKELQETFKLLEGDYKKLTLKEYPVEGVPFEITKEQAIGVALNSGNQGNRDRLLTKLTPEQINNIIKSLSPKELKFVKGVFKTIKSLFPDIEKTSKTLLGIKPNQVEGDYFPIYADRELSRIARINEAKQDLFQDIFDVTFIPRGFIYKRVGGKDPVDLNVFNVIFKHLDSVLHFNTMAIPVRDVQKIVTDPRFDNMVTELLGKENYKELTGWLKRVANPKEMQAKNIFDDLAQVARHNATTSILGYRLVTSMLQGGSITLAIDELGLPAVSKGIIKFHSDRKGMQDWVYSLSPSMKYRAKQIDREIKDWIKTKQAKDIIKGRRDWSEMMFDLIRIVDYATIMPTWIAAYDKRFAEIADVKLSAQYADMILRTTQPQAGIENMASIMAGSPTQKMFTSFMTFFSVFHNSFVYSLDKMKFHKGTDSYRNKREFARSMWWKWVLPAVLGATIRAGGTPSTKKVFAEIATYPFGGVIIARDLANMIVKGFDIGAPPAMRGITEVGYTVKSKNLGNKIKHGLKAIGLLTGKIPLQAVDTLEGFLQLLSGATQDLRRLVFTEKAVE